MIYIMAKILMFFARGVIGFAVLKYLFRTEIIDDFLFLIVTAVIMIWVCMAFSDINGSK